MRSSAQAIDTLATIGTPRHAAERDRVLALDPRVELGRIRRLVDDAVLALDEESEGDYAAAILALDEVATDLIHQAASW